MVAALTKDGLEAEVARIASRFHEDQHGCKADRTSAHIVDDLVIVRSSGCFTPTELNLVKTDDGRKIVKSARVELRSLTRRQIESQISKVVGENVVRSFWDLDIRVGDQIEVYVLDRAIE